jgi:hypothetical protein
MNVKETGMEQKKTIFSIYKKRQPDVGSVNQTIAANLSGDEAYGRFPNLRFDLQGAIEKFFQKFLGLKKFFNASVTVTPEPDNQEKEKNKETDDPKSPFHIDPSVTPVYYNQDGLISIHSHDFIRDPNFISAYERGVQANGYDFHWHWRVHVVLWAAAHAFKLNGDFVECGVNKGFLSAAITQYLDWHKTNKHFFLFDTFCGLDESQLSQEEIDLGRMNQSRQMYSECFEQTVKNFSEYKNVKIIRGTVPETLDTIKIDQVSFLSIDMNNAKPEIAAAEYFWPKLVSGAIVVLDDYAYCGYWPQKKAFDQFAELKNIKILTLPTGQGLFIKP